MGCTGGSIQMPVVTILLIILWSSADSRSNFYRDAACTISDRDFTVVFLSEPPYVLDNSLKIGNGLIYDYVKAALVHCFAQYRCNTKNIIWKKVSTQDDLSAYVLNGTADIAIPITPSLSASLAEEWEKSGNDRVTIVGVLKSPGLAMVIDYSACKDQIASKTTATILSAWPICAAMLLLAGISGISIWALEMHSGEREFPSSFGRGSSEGFWWAFVTMTTVGYGDKVPRTLWGRLFSILWMLIGLCLVSVFTAAITSAITVSSVGSDCQKIQGKQIAALNGSDAEKESRHPGANVTVYESEMAMFQSLQAGRVDGAMLDRFKAYYYLDQLNDDRLRVALQIDSPQEYSVALVNRSVPQLTAKNGCLEKYLVGSHSRLRNRLLKRYVRPVKALGSAAETVGVLSIKSPANKKLLIASLVIFVVFLISGVSWEYVYRRDHFNLFKTASSDKHTSGIPLTQQLTDVQEALKNLQAQVQKIQESLQATRGMTGMITNGQKDFDISMESELSTFQQET